MGNTQGYFRSICNVRELWSGRDDSADANRCEEEVLILVEFLEIPVQRSRAGTSHAYPCQRRGFARSRQLFTEAQPMSGAALAVFQDF
jgi:hypothetical protein